VTDAGIGDQLAAWGKVAILETRGRVSGRTARAAVGFIEEADGSLLVAAGSDTTGWARNLESDPLCNVTIGDRSGAYSAATVEGPDRNLAIAELILRYGTPSEGLGHGPVFRLRRVSTAGDAPSG
jgi:deazaflavin-dependent oxidoreductase (nitroreductase family)